MQAENIQFKYTQNVAEVMRLDLGGEDSLVIRGDPDNAAYEWVLIEGGKVANHSDDGYGWALSAMRDGLVFYTGEE